MCKSPHTQRRQKVASWSNRSSKLVRYFKKSGTNNELKSTLKSFSPTRWNTTFYLLQSIEKNWSEIIKVLQERRELQRIDGISLQIISSLVDIVQNFKKDSTLLEGEQYPAMDIAFAHVHLLKKKNVSNDSDASLIKKFKDSLALNIQNVVMENLTLFHKVDLFLNPPANKLTYFHESEKKEIIDECKRQMRIYDTNLCDTFSQIPSYNIKSSANLEALEDFVVQSSTLQSTDKVSDEIQHYSKLNVALSNDFKILKWWHLHENQYPLLYKVSCKVFAITASSTSSARVFAVKRNLILDRRTRMCVNDSTIGQLMFLHSNAKNDPIEHQDIN